MKHILKDMSEYDIVNYLKRLITLNTNSKHHLKMIREIREYIRNKRIDDLL